MIRRLRASISMILGLGSLVLVVALSVFLAIFIYDTLGNTWIAIFFALVAASLVALIIYLVMHWPQVPAPSRSTELVR